MPIETRNGVSYATHDGVALAGDLYLPAGAGPFPALVGVHGGGWQAGARNAFQFWGPYLAERGYALFDATTGNLLMSGTLGTATKGGPRHPEEPAPPEPPKQPEPPR